MPDIRDNRNLVDNSTAQRLDQDDIQKLKDRGAQAHEIVGALITSSKTFQGKTSFSQEKYNAAIDVDDVAGEQGYSTLERNSCRPSFDICGMWSGYTGEGSKTVLPAKAYAKVSCRLVANQDHEEISRAFVDYIRQIAPKGVRVKVQPMHGGQGYVCPIDIPAYKAAERGFEIAFGKRPLAARRGGSIPIIAAFEQILGRKTILMGFGLEQNAIHSPNESMDLDVWRRGIVAVTEFYRAYSTMH